MTIKTVITVGVISGTILSLYVLLTVFSRFDLSVWLAFHNLLVGLTLLVAVIIGLRSSGSSFLRALAEGTLYYLTVIGIYLTTYILVTTVLVDRLAWIPFWDRDYTYHGFSSVRAYMDHRTNFLDLLVLQVFSCAVCSVLYIGSTALGVAVAKLAGRAA